MDRRKRALVCGVLSLLASACTRPAPPARTPPVPAPPDDPPAPHPEPGTRAPAWPLLGDDAPPDHYVWTDEREPPHRETRKPAAAQRSLSRPIER